MMAPTWQMVNASPVERLQVWGDVAEEGEAVLSGIPNALGSGLRGAQGGEFRMGTSNAQGGHDVRVCKDPLSPCPERGCFLAVQSAPMILTS